MKAPALTCASALALALSASPCPGQDTPASLAGRWKGHIAGAGAPLEMGFVVEEDGDGWSGTVDTPAQGLFGLPLSAVERAEDGTFSLEVALTGGRFEASLEEGGARLSGKWLQRGQELPLVCTRQPAWPPVPAALRAALTGLWEGVLVAGPVELRLELHLEGDASGGLGGYMRSPDQSPKQVPVTRVDLLDDGGARVCIGSTFSTFDVAPGEGGGQLEGEFRQGGQAFPISLARVEAPTEVRRPQEPRPPFPYSAEDVVYQNEAGGVTLAGTLTIPEGEGPFPSVLLITGSGSQDRDETVFQHKPFWVIADHLGRRGIAALRVDDRGVGGSSAGPDGVEGATSADFVGDVLAGVRLLAGRPELAPDRIGLMGHSEGGTIAPLAAVRSEDVAFIILLAGVGIRGDRLLMLQNELIARAGGMDEDELQEQLGMQARLFEVVLDETLSPEEAGETMRAILEESPRLSPGEEGEREIDGVLAQLGNPWVRWFVRHDPAPVLERVSCPVLAINGELDLQVPSGANLDAIESALRRGGNPDFTVRPLAGLNHLFQHCETGQVAEYGQIEETFAPEVLQLLADWIAERFLDGD